MDISFHYPPELMNLLIDTIPLLNKSKHDVFLFFQGAGVPDQLMRKPYNQWRRDRDSIRKSDIARHVLVELNEKGERSLRLRREVLKRVVEFENFSCCWPAEQLKAKGLVAEIRNVVNVKDSFTRMAKEREAERLRRITEVQENQEKARKKREELFKIKNELFALFGESNRQKRGKKLEAILNRMFSAYGILIRQAFTLRGNEGEGVLEQIDGVIEIEADLYFVEMKWWENPLGVPEVSQHFPRMMLRAESRAIIVTATDFTVPAVRLCQDFLQQKVVVLCTLREIVMLLERQGDLLRFFKQKINAAIIDRNPYTKLAG